MAVGISFDRQMMKLMNGWRWGHHLNENDSLVLEYHAYTIKKIITYRLSGDVNACLGKTGSD